MAENPIDPEATSLRPRRAGALGAAGAAASGAGAALVATAATACCAGPVIAPLVVAVLGASGAAWAAGLKPYSPWLLAGSALMLAFGFWSTYRKPARCAVPAATSSARNVFAAKAARAVLWLAALMWLLALVAQFTLQS